MKFIPKHATIKMKDTSRAALKMKQETEIIGIKKESKPLRIKRNTISKNLYIYIYYPTMPSNNMEETGQ